MGISIRAKEDLGPFSQSADDDNLDFYSAAASDTEMLWVVPGRYSQFGKDGVLLIVEKATGGPCVGTEVSYDFLS